ncbi:MAG TPA: patatin-like phospholipase family protein [Chitinophagales bacterium]|nr:patatin-like phospholipase family protein [Chitinophagales bacterium]
MPTFNILSIDGGGLRGIVPIRILQKIEEKRKDKLLNFIDMVSGTSTGGLLASCITLPGDKVDNGTLQPKFNLDDIAEIYIKYGSTIFPTRNGLLKWLYYLKGLFSPAYSPAGLEKVLNQYAGHNKRVLDALRPIMVSTYDLKQNSPVFFKTAEAHDNHTANALIYDICRATSAAPTYFPAHHFVYKGKKLTGIDGGVYVNNPAMAAIAEVSKYGPQAKGFYRKRDGSLVQYDDIRVLSLGTGSYEGHVTNKDAVSWGQLQWVTHIIDIMMTGVNQTTTYESGEMLDDFEITGKRKYLRLDIKIHDKKYAQMDDARPETREYLERQIKSQVTENPDVLIKIDEFLNNIS